MNESRARRSILPHVPLESIRVDGGVVLVHRELPVFCATNEVGLACAGFLDGRHTAKDLADFIDEKSQCGQEAALEHAEAFLGSLERAGFFARRSPLSLPMDLDSLFIHVTNACNLKCRHCYAVSGPGKAAALSLKTVRAMIEELAGRGGKAVTLSGGEPLLWPHLEDAIRFAFSCGLAVQILTNGTLLNETWADVFLSTGAGVQVSLDGPSAQIHEVLRGPKSFEPAVRGLKILRDAGMSRNSLSVSVQITRPVAADPESMIALSHQCGAGLVRFLTLRPAGRAAEADAPLGLSLEETLGFLDKADAAREKWRGRIEVTTGITGTGLDSVPSPWCPVGRKLVIAADGSVYPCVLMMGPEFLVGHVGEGSLTEILSGTRMKAATEAVHRRMDEIAACKRCEWRAFCQGGCAGIALAGSDTLQARDGMCQWRKNWYRSAVQRLVGTGA